MQFRHLKTFVAVAATGNITRAGERVHLAQSSVTEQIQALEEDLGAALFERTRRGLRPTPAGRCLLDYAQRLLALADEARAAVADAAGQVAGRLAIGGLETLCATRLPPLLAAFGREYPAVELQLGSAGSGPLRAAVIAGELDVGFVFGEAAGDAALCRQVVAREPLVVIVPAGHRLAKRRALMPGDLAGETFLATEPGCVYRRMFDEAFPAAAAGRPRLAGSFGSLAAVRAMVEAGAGCALLPKLAAEGRFAALPWRGPESSVAVTMLWRRQGLPPPPLRLFLDAARAGLAEAMPADARLPRAAPCR
ncbi:LysR family transcriptional regulator [Frateuria sp. Soil773]|uniref:LysR family transcriptional regulator n=1 Tax=Frateuria sp. Soil773 TaxID=1736407 RepID=UPI0009E6D3EB|nr:LysR family transcriptional regulator [Frateuria sp. Soil773]